MRTIIFILPWLVPILDHAGELPIPGSQSPDHKYEVYAVDPRAEGAVAHLEVRVTRNGSSLFNLGSSGWVETAGALTLPVNTTVLWTSNSQRFALKLRGGKTDSEVTVYQIVAGTISQIPLPNLAQTIRKEAQFEEGRFYFESPVKWRDHRTLVIEISGNTIDYIDPDGEYDYKYDLTVDVDSAKITSIVPLKKALPPPNSGH